MEAKPVFISYEMSTKFHVTTTIFCTIALPSLAANIFLLFIVCRSTAFRDLSTMLVTFISFADTIYLLYTSIYIIVRYMDIALPDPVSTTFVTMQSVLRMVPACTFLLIGYNWYLAAFKPALCYKFHQLPHVTSKCFLATWLVSLVTNTGVPFVVVSRFDKVGFTTYSVVIVVVFYLLPLIAEVILHLKNLKKMKSELQDPSKRKTLLAYNQKITKVFLILSVSFFLFTSPILLYPLFDILGVKSSPFAVFVYHLTSCLPCLMNPLCHYIISQKFQDEFRGLFCMKKLSNNVTKKASEKEQFTPEAFSANKGFFDPCTPSWRQGTEYWNRELIYGEYPSVVPEEQPKKRRSGVKDVRFSDVVEEFVPEDSVSCHQSTSKITVQAIISASEEKTTQESVQPTNSDPVTDSSPSTGTPPDENTKSTGRKPVSRSVSHLGTWPRRDKPLRRHNVADVKQEVLLRAGTPPQFPQEARYKNKNVGRSKSFYVPSSGGADRAIITGEVFKAVSKTKKREVQVHVNVCEEKTIIQTYL